MPVYIQCNSCNRKLRVRTELLGKSVRCPSCRAKFIAAGPPAAQADEGAGQAVEGGSSAAGAETAFPASHGEEEASAESSNPTVRRPIQTSFPETVAPLAPPPEAITKRASQQVEEPQLAIEEEKASEVVRPDQAPFETPWARVALVMGLIVLVVVLLGLAGAWWVNAGIRAAQGKRAAQGLLPYPRLAVSTQPGAAAVRLRPRSS